MLHDDHDVIRARFIRERNQRLILRLMFRAGLLSQSKAVQKTGLKAPTVFRIFTELEQKGLIEAANGTDVGRHGEDPQPARKGRRPLEYRLKPDAAYIVGIDFWARSAAAVVQDFAGNQIASRSLCFSSPPSADEACAIIAHLIRDMLDGAGIDSQRLLGIGVGAPGSVGALTGVVHFYSRIPGMIEYPLGARLQEAFAAPVIVTNNASIAALAEERYGKAHGAASLFCFLVRAGVGGAYLQNGKLISDRSRTAFEVGHLSMDPHGRECSCGNRGCLELYLNEDAACAALSALAPCPDMETLDAIIAQGSPEVERLLEPLLEAASHAVKDIRRLLAPEAIAIITRSKAFSELIVKAASADLVNFDARFGPSGARLIASEYNAQLACKAACDLVYEAFFSHGLERSDQGGHEQ
ncbi:MAG: ROK family transcriptional regulator [Spirochaetales bacterium]|nr:ROK family transcriptional regulator [Spirochaetales bacterium]